MRGELRELRRRGSGFTLAEIIIALALSMMLMIAVYSLFKLSMGFSRFGKSYNTFLNKFLSNNPEFVSILSSAGAGYPGEVAIVIYGTGNSTPFDYLWVSNGYIAKDITSTSLDSSPVYAQVSAVSVSSNQVTLTLYTPYPSSSNKQLRIGVNYFTLEDPTPDDPSNPTVTVIVDSSIGKAPTCIVNPKLSTCSGNECPSIRECVETVSADDCSRFTGYSFPTSKCFLIASKNTYLISSIGFLSRGAGVIIYRDSGGSVDFIFAGRILSSDIASNQVVLEIKNDLAGVSDSSSAGNIQIGDKLIPAYLFYPEVIDPEENLGILYLNGRRLIDRLEVFKVGFEWDSDLDGDNDYRAFSVVYPLNDQFLPIAKLDVFIGFSTEPDNSYTYPQGSYQVGYDDAYYLRSISGLLRKSRHFTFRVTGFPLSIRSNF